MVVLKTKNFLRLLEDHYFNSSKKKGEIKREDISFLRPFNIKGINSRIKNLSEKI